jgi:hypothetical protein
MMTRHAYTRAPRNLRESLSERLASRAFDRHCKCYVHCNSQRRVELQVELNLSCHFRNVEHDTAHQKNDSGTRSAPDWCFHEYDFVFPSSAGLARFWPNSSQVRQNIERDIRTPFLGGNALDLGPMPARDAAVTPSTDSRDALRQSLSKAFSAAEGVND